MGRASRQKWQNRHARRTSDLVAAGQPFEDAVAQAFREVQYRRGVLSYLRERGFGLKRLLRSVVPEAAPIIPNKVPGVGQ